MLTKNLIQRNNQSSGSHSSRPFFHPTSASTLFRAAESDKPFFGSSPIQAKLTVGQPNDKYEKEADSMAEQVVQRMENPHSSPTVQRKCDNCEQEEKVQKKEKEEETLSLKPDISKVEATSSPTNNTTVGSGLEARLQSSKGGGQGLDSTTRGQMEQGFGVDFSNVKIHTGTEAVQMSQELGAQAFTTGNNIYFNQGHYAPGTKSGNTLLAHELTHVVQQSGGESIQRKILIGGKPYTPGSQYYTWLRSYYSEAMVEFIRHMHNDGKSPDFAFASLEEMGNEVKIRSNAIDGMGEVHKTCCGYPPAGRSGYLNPTYWDKKSDFHFVVKSPLPSGKNPSDAINAIFEAGAGTLLECNSTMVAIQYRAMLKTLGEAKFNAKFASGAGILISPHHDPGPAGLALHPIWDQKLYQQVTITSSADLLPGDWVYYKNIDDYIVKHPGGLWSGEHTMYLGGGKFRGFGVDPSTEAELLQKLLNAYNTGLPVADQKTLADLPGLRDYARRPVVQEIMK